MGLSNLGIFHTAVGIIAIVAALASFVKHGKINLESKSGNTYFFGTIITSATALGLSRAGGFNPGHVLSLLVLALVVGAFVLHQWKTGNNKARYFENFFLSFSFFLSMIPTVNETLTRVPLKAPLASGPGDPLIGKTLLVILVLFIAGSCYQYIQQKKTNKRA
ncbi:hypothetical protein [Parapedobacter koreensis]|uniref:Transmembrane protein n=1 Tax=Parapedobacter koreensis TaxID=332977 RepID=A0A1H7Q8L5_9SPHI|nr:hypothetical protein [Parapedobacter koreensis]SEL44501.1 hypothetical protein SAMN05421740_105244 [Parapedobacter koreensis]